MLPYAYAWIHQRTGWDTWYINLLLVFVAALLTMAALLLTIRPEGFRTVALVVLGLMVLGLIAALQGTADDLREIEAKQSAAQIELLTLGKPTFWSLFLRRIRITTPYMIAIGLFIGLPLALAGE